MFHESIYPSFVIQCVDLRSDCRNAENWATEKRQCVDNKRASIIFLLRATVTRDFCELRVLYVGQIEKTPALAIDSRLFSGVHISMPVYISMPWKWNGRRHSAARKWMEENTSRVYTQDICLSTSARAAERQSAASSNSISDTPTRHNAVFHLPWYRLELYV